MNQDLLKRMREGLTAGNALVAEGPYQSLRSSSGVKAEDFPPTIREKVSTAPIKPESYGVMGGEHGGGHGAYFWGVQLPKDYDAGLVNTLTKTFGLPASDTGGRWEWRSNTASGMSLETAAKIVRWWKLTHGQPLAPEDAGLEAMRDEAMAYEEEMRSVGLAASPENKFYKVTNPFPVYVIEGDEPTGDRGQSGSEFLRPKVRELIAQPDDEIHVLVGGTFIIPADAPMPLEILFSRPQSGSVFEKRGAQPIPSEVAKSKPMAEIPAAGAAKVKYRASLQAGPAFNTWLDTFIQEKGIDLEQTFEVEGPSGQNTIPYGVIIEHMKIAPPQEQAAIKDTLVKLDFKNASIENFLKHLGKAIAASKTVVTTDAVGILKVGDEVLWTSSYGRGTESPAKVESITLGNSKGDTEGVEVTQINWELVPEWVTVGLADGKGWAYGYQLKPMPSGYKVEAARKPSRARLEQAAREVLTPEEQALYRQLTLVDALHRFGDDATPEMIARMKQEGLIRVEVYEGIPLDPYLTPAGEALTKQMYDKVLSKLGVTAAMAKPGKEVKEGLRKGISQQKDPGCWPDRLFDMPGLYKDNLGTIQDQPPQSGVSTVS